MSFIQFLSLSFLFLFRANSECKLNFSFNYKSVDQKCRISNDKFIFQDEVHLIKCANNIFFNEELFNLFPFLFLPVSFSVAMPVIKYLVHASRWKYSFRLGSFRIRSSRTSFCRLVSSGSSSLRHQDRRSDCTR